MHPQAPRDISHLKQMPTQASPSSTSSTCCAKSHLQALSNASAIHFHGHSGYEVNTICKALAHKEIICWSAMQLHEAQGQVCLPNYILHITKSIHTHPMPKSCQNCTLRLASWPMLTPYSASGPIAPMHNRHRFWIRIWPSAGGAASDATA